jgi:hypothetical protein
MGNPANPTGGQKIVFQITQGAAGSSTITWGSAFDFSSGLPQPALSTTAGQTDLLAFIYNAAMGKWLLVAFVNGFNPTTTTAPPAGTYRLFPSTNGPSSAVAYGGAFLAGVLSRSPRGAPGWTASGGGSVLLGSPPRRRSSLSGPCTTSGTEPWCPRPR